jgi:hypothetical protein
MRLNPKFVAAALAIAGLAGIGLGVFAPAALGARDNEARVEVELSCLPSAKGVQVAVELTALLRDSTVDISLALRDESGNSAVVEGYPEVAGLFKDTAEGETGLGRHHLILVVTSGEDTVLQLESAAELTTASCVEGNRIFVGELTLIEPIFGGGVAE